jgi:ketosteroid isomerase-like protein
MSALAAALVGLLLLGADAPKDDAVKEVEKALDVLNDAFVKRDTDAIKRLMTPDHVAITTYYGGPINLAGTLATAPDFKLTEMTAGKKTFTILSKDAVLINYELTQKGTYKGKEVPSKAYVSTVWVKRGNVWQEALYQETPLDAK